MANKPIIDIAVNDQQFKAFFELFQEYQQHLESMPEDWGNVNAAVEETGQSMESLAASAGEHKEFLMIAAIQANAIANALDKAAGSQRKLGGSLKKGASDMERMASAAMRVGKSLMGWGAFGVIGGLATLAGGLFGMRELGAGAVKKEREARGLGITPGELEAFKVDMGRYVDPSILEHVANAKNSYQGRVWLGMATGQTAGQVQEQASDALAMKLAVKAHDWWNNTPEWMRTAENLRATGFPQAGLTLDDMRRLGNTPIQSLTDAQAQYAKDKGTLGFSPATTDAWYKLTRALDLAGKSIETVLVNKLDVLAPKLGEFINTLTEDAKVLIDEVLTPQNLNKFADAIRDTVTYLGSKEFRQNLRDFGEAIADVTRLILKVARWFGEDSATTGIHADENPGLEEQLGQSNTPSATVPAHGVVSRQVAKALGMASPSVIPADQQAFLSRLEEQQALPRGWLAAVYDTESTGGKNLHSPKGAEGPFQFMRDTATKYGVLNPMDFGDSARGAAHFYADLFKKYGQDQRKALAAYNWGETRLDADIARWGGRWEEHAPRETRDYIDRVLAHVTRTTAPAKDAGQANQSSDVPWDKFLAVLSRRQSPQMSRIHVQNDTASRIAVSVNAAGF